MVLKSPGPFTVFAPNNDTFAKLPPGTIQTLVQNIPQLTRILKYHVTDESSMTSQPIELEGTWEEIFVRAAELVGRRVRVIALFCHSPKTFAISERRELLYMKRLPTAPAKLIARFFSNNKYSHQVFLIG